MYCIKWFNMQVFIYKKNSEKKIYILTYIWPYIWFGIWVGIYFFNSQCLIQDFN